MTMTSGRLLRLLSLLQARRYWPGDELADRLEVSGRTIRRDVERLRELGYPVDATTGPDGGYRLEAGTAMPPLLLDDDEAVAIAVGLRTAAGASVTGIEETSVRALVKLEQVLPPHLRRRVNALGSATRRSPAGPDGTQVDPEALTVIAGACRDRERLRFAYTARDGAETRRHVEPLSLVNLGRRWYLVAWDCDRRDWRTFRMDRIPKLPRTRRAVRAARLPTAWTRHVRQPEPVGRAVPPPGARDAARAGGRGRGRPPLGAGQVEPIDEQRAATRPATTRWSGWRCGSRSWAWTSRCTSRRACRAVRGAGAPVGAAAGQPSETSRTL